MEHWQIIVLGIIQGITEFLPISSSGHLILAPLIFNFPDQGLALDAILHLATLVSIIIFFRTDLWLLLKSLFERQPSPHRRLAWSIFFASFPAGLVGLFFGNFIETVIRSPLFVTLNLILWSFVFWYADFLASRRGNPVSKIDKISLNQVLLIGFAQAIALLPGTSRSGITIAAGLVGNLGRTMATRFSFLLGAPIIFAAGVYKLNDFVMSSDGNNLISWEQCILGFGVAFASGYLSIHLLLKIVPRMGLRPFVIYRLVLGIILLVFFL